MRRGTIAGVLSGALGLTLLDAFLAGPSPKAAGTILQGVATVVQHLADPSVPLIPDLRPAPTPGGPAAGGGVLMSYTTGTPPTATAPSRLPPILTT